MTWCSHCGKDCETFRDYAIKCISCVKCGKVLAEYIYPEEVRFVKDGTKGVQAPLADVCSESHRRTFGKGDKAINKLIEKFERSNVSDVTRCDEIIVRRDIAWCPYCARKHEIYPDYTTNTISCMECGKISQSLYVGEALFGETMTSS